MPPLTHSAQCCQPVQLALKFAAMIMRTVPLVAQQRMGTKDSDGKDDVCFGLPCSFPHQPQSSLQQVRLSLEEGHAGKLGWT